MLEGISLDLAIESFSFLFFTSLVYKRKLQKNGSEVVSNCFIFIKFFLKTWIPIIAMKC